MILVDILLLVARTLASYDSRILLFSMADIYMILQNGVLLRLLQLLGFIIFSHDQIQLDRLNGGAVARLLFIGSLICLHLS